MKIKHTGDRIAAIILGVTLLFGVGLGSRVIGQVRDNNGDYYQNPQDRDWNNYPNWGGSFELRQTALNAGYNEGAKEGRNDYARGRRSNFQNFSAYQEATKDYNSRLGDRELYRRYFRRAFENGYNSELQTTYDSTSRLTGPSGWIRRAATIPAMLLIAQLEAFAATSDRVSQRACWRDSNHLRCWQSSAAIQP